MSSSLNVTAKIPKVPFLLSTICKAPDSLGHHVSCRDAMQVIQVVHTNDCFRQSEKIQQSQSRACLHSVAGHEMQAWTISIADVRTGAKPTA